MARNVEEELDAIRAALVHILHHGLPKSETDAAATAKTLEPKESSSGSKKS